MTRPVSDQCLSWSWSCSFGLGLGLNILVLFPIVKMINKANNQLITVYTSFNYLVINTGFYFTLWAWA